MQAKSVKIPHDDDVVISMTIANYDVKENLVDTESFVDILFYDAFCKMNLSKD